jgi:hypothetical protein
MYVVKSCVQKESAQLLGFRHHPICTILGRSLEIYVPFESVTDGGVVGSRRPPDAEKQSSARYENAMHLAQRAELIREKL